MSGDHPHRADRPHENEPGVRADSGPCDDGRVYVAWSALELDTGPHLDARNGHAGWDRFPAVRAHPDRPPEADIHLSAERRQHILDGDPAGMGGGHRHGTGREFKTEFPADWDDDTVGSYVLDVARAPDREPEQQENRRWRCFGTRDGVGITVIVWPEGKIWTAYPEPGGRGVVYNAPQETQENR